VSNLESSSPSTEPGQLQSHLLATAHPGRVEGRASASIVVLRQLQVEALAVHAPGDAPDTQGRLPLGQRV